MKNYTQLVSMVKRLNKAGMKLDRAVMAVANSYGISSVSLAKKMMGA